LNLLLLEEVGEDEFEKFKIYSRNVEIIQNFQHFNAEQYAQEEFKKVLKKSREDYNESMLKKLPRGSKIPKIEDEELIDEVAKGEKLKVFTQEYLENLILSKEGLVVNFFFFFHIQVG
jgi:hypothetical protein